jgi:hypothetical protein
MVHWDGSREAFSDFLILALVFNSHHCFFGVRADVAKSTATSGESSIWRRADSVWRSVK